MKYVPGRRYEGKEALKCKGSYLRDERLNQKPCSFDKLENFLKERRRHLSTYIRETREVEVGRGGVFEEDMGGVEEDLEMGQAGTLGQSEDEEAFSDALDVDQDSD